MAGRSPLSRIVMSAPAPLVSAPEAPVGASYAPPAAASLVAPPAEDGVAVAPPVDGALAVPRDTTPTWELELLVSGAVLFGLFQAIGLLEEFIARWEPHLGIVGMFALVGGGLLLRAALWGLTGCFVVHLAMRAYWVALVGVHSVFPGGPRWEFLAKYGPIQAELTRERVLPLPTFIAKVDNAASLLFATGFYYASSLAISSVLLAPMGVLMWLGERFFGMRGLWAGLVLATIPAVAIGMLPAAIDYARRGRPLAPRSRLARLVRTGLRLALSQVPRSIRSLGAVLTSNVAPRTTLAIMGGGIAIMGATMVASIVGGGLPGEGSYTFFADASASSLAPQRYASSGVAGAGTAADPWIDGDVVTGPYLRLSIPYRPLVHERALGAACPGLAPVPHDDDIATPAGRAAAEAVLRCAEKVHVVTLDGARVAVRFRFLADPESNRRVFRAYVPVADLASGEHVLRVEPARRPDRPSRGPRRPYEIPFWK